MVLLTIGLGVFGVGTSALFRRSQYQRLDQQLQNSVDLVAGSLRENAGLGGGPSGPSGRSPNGSTGDPGGGEGGPRRPPVVVSPDTYAELRDSSGTVLADIALSDGSDTPDLTGDLSLAGADSRLLTTGSTSGSGEWRVNVATVQDPAGATVVIAVPLTEVTDALHRLELIELLAAAVLLVAVGGGAWLILRHDLRPLERMATSARSISSGDLSRRVEPSEDRTEVGQLGLALNTMLTELEQAFAERDRTEQRLRQFLADASHELRTPLTSIQGFAELFRMGADQDRVQLAVILRRIEEESARMKVLVEDLLLLARLDQTRPSERAPVDLAVLAADACSDAVAADPDRRVTLDAAAPVIVLGDTDHLRQAIANLVNNALQHTATGTPIEVTASVVDGHAVVVIRDHGPGLGVDALDHAFDRFWQADGARVGHGAGLGLAIVAGIAAEHGGRVSAANAEDGTGATFTLCLPLDAERPPGSMPPAAAA